MISRNVPQAPTGDLTHLECVSWRQERYCGHFLTPAIARDLATINWNWKSYLEPIDIAGDNQQVQLLTCLALAKHIWRQQSRNHGFA